MKFKSIVMALLLASGVYAVETTEQTEELFMCKQYVMNDVLAGSKLVDYSNSIVLGAYFDTLKKNKTTVTLWVIHASLIDNEQAYRNNEGYVKALVEMDLKNKKFRYLKAAGYTCDGSNSLNNYGDKPSDWDHIVPGSLYDSLHASIIKIKK